MHSLVTIVMLLVFIISISNIPTSNATNFSKKLDQTLMPLPPQQDGGIKCTACSSCENTCGQYFSPPPPSPPPPPPPSPPPPAAQNCNPNTPPPPRFIYITGPPGNLYPEDSPPPPRFVYITGPPGNLYPVDSYDLDLYSGGSACGPNVQGLLLLLVLCGLLLELLVF